MSINLQNVTAKIRKATNDRSGYPSDQVKDDFHRSAKAYMKHLAEQMGIKPDQYEIRSNKGGIAVLGEVTLHTDRIYVQVSDYSHGVLYRAVSGRKDYTGKANRWMKVEDFLNPETSVREFKATSERGW